MENIVFEVNSILVEHTHSLILELRERNYEYNKLLDDIRDYRNNLKDKLDKDTWLSVKSLIRLMMRQNLIDKAYLYCQGMKDITTISNFVDCEFADIFFREKEVEDDF